MATQKTKSAKKKLSLEGRIIKILMERQLIDRKELEGLLHVGRTQLWRTLKLLKQEELLKDGPKGKLMLFCYSDLDIRVADALREFKNERYEAVGIYDLANRVGEPPSVVEAPAFRLAGTVGVRIDSVSKARVPVKTFLGPEQGEGKD